MGLEIILSILHKWHLSENVKDVMVIETLTSWKMEIKWKRCFILLLPYNNTDGKYDCVTTDIVPDYHKADSVLDLCYGVRITLWNILNNFITLFWKDWADMAINCIALVACVWLAASCFLWLIAFEFSIIMYCLSLIYQLVPTYSGNYLLSRGYPSVVINNAVFVCFENGNKFELNWIELSSTDLKYFHFNYLFTIFDLTDVGYSI